LGLLDSYTWPQVEYDDYPIKHHPIFIIIMDMDMDMDKEDYKDEYEYDL
jgi:hypothetical protein